MTEEGVEGSGRGWRREWGRVGGQMGSRWVRSRRVGALAEEKADGGREEIKEDGFMGARLYGGLWDGWVFFWRWEVLSGKEGAE